MTQSKPSHKNDNQSTLVLAIMRARFTEERSKEMLSNLIFCTGDDERVNIDMTLKELLEHCNVISQDFEESGRF